MLIFFKRVVNVNVSLIKTTKSRYVVCLELTLI